MHISKQSQDIAQGVNKSLEDIEERFDLTPRGIMKYLDLQIPIFKLTTNYGHFGKDNNSKNLVISLFFL